MKLALGNAVWALSGFGLGVPTSWGFWRWTYGPPAPVAEEPLGLQASNLEEDILRLGIDIGERDKQIAALKANATDVQSKADQTVTSLEDRIKNRDEQIAKLKEANSAAYQNMTNLQGKIVERDRDTAQVKPFSPLRDSWDAAQRSAIVLQDAMRYAVGVGGDGKNGAEEVQMQFKRPGTLHGAATALQSFLPERLSPGEWIVVHASKGDEHIELAVKRFLGVHPQHVGVLAGPSREPLLAVLLVFGLPLLAAWELFGCFLVLLYLSRWLFRGGPCIYCKRRSNSDQAPPKP